MDTNLQYIKEMELKFRNKIIELEKQLQYENLRANQYQAKFKEAVMDNSSKRGDQQLLTKLTQKQSQIYQLRRQLLEANRKLNQPNRNEDVDELMSQNQEMRNVVQQLKNAAIAAIMEKDNEIQMLKRQLSQMDLAQHVAELEERNIQLENQIQIKVAEYEQQIKKLNQKLSIERDGFSQKITYLHKQFSHQQNQKELLLEKAQSLQGNLQNLEKVVQKYQAKISEIQHIRSSQKINFTKNEYQLQRRIDNLLEDIKHIQKNQQKLHETIAGLNKTIQEQNRKIEFVNEEKEELDRKLKIKNRKNNSKEISNSIFESFEGFSKKADVYASFAKKQHHRDMTKQSFVGEPIKLSDIKEIQIQMIENFDMHIPDINEISHHKKKDSISVEESKSNVYEAKTTESQTIAKTDSLSNKKVEEYEQKIRSLLNQIDQCNKAIESITKQLQKERQDKLQLKSKNSTLESEFKVEKQSLRLHVYKLENALLIQKLQNAQKLQSNKQIRELEKKLFEDQIKKLKTEIENSKKKKGFFG